MNLYLNNEQVKYKQELQNLLKSNEGLMTGDGLKDFVNNLISEEVDYVTKITVMIEATKKNSSIALNLVEAMINAQITNATKNSLNYSLALTEREAGSDLSNLTTTATKKNNQFILSGEKSHVLVSKLTEYLVVLAKVDNSSLAFFLVPMDNPSLSKTDDALSGVTDVVSSQIKLNNVKVSDDTKLMEIDESQSQLKQLLDQQTLYFAAISVGVAELALQNSLEYSRERIQFGKQIGEYQAIQFKIAEMTVGINAAKTLLYEAAHKLDNQESDIPEIYMSKVNASEISNKAVNHTYQIHGSDAATKASVIAKLYQFQRMLEVYGQTSEILRLEIANKVIESF